MPFGLTFVDTDALADVRARLVRIERAMTSLARAEQQNLELIMSKISEFAGQVSAFFDRQDVAVAGLQGDVQSLTDEIAKLQASAGEVTPEDQALLDGIQVRAGAIADKLAALDAMTPPVATPPVV